MEKEQRSGEEKSSLGSAPPTFLLLALSTPYQAGVFVPSPYPCKQASYQVSSGFRIPVLHCGKEGGKSIPTEGVLAI